MGFRQFRPIEHGEFFCVGVDTASGGKDYSVAQFISKTRLDVPLVYHANVSTVVLTNALLPVLERLYDITGTPPMVAYERQNGGVFELERLNTLNRANKFRIYTTKPYGKIENPTESKIGWDTNAATRPKMLADLKEVVDHQVLRIYDSPTVSELFTFVINKSGKPEADTGAHDDLVMSLAIALQLYQTENAISSVNYIPYNKTKWTIQ